MTVTPLKHIVFIAGPNLTHLRSGTKFCVRLVQKFPNAYISVYTFAPFATQANAYLSTQDDAARERVRIVPSAIGTFAAPLDIVYNMEKSFAPWILEQIAVESFEAYGQIVAPPSWIIEDHINGGVCLVNKEQHKLPFLSWWATTAAAMIAHFGNEEHGGGGRLLEHVSAAITRSDKNKPLIEIFSQELTDRVITIPGLPPYYEHEQIPQLTEMILPLICALQTRWNRFRDEMEVAVFNSPYEMEPIAAEACANAFTKPVLPLCVGPSVDLPPSTQPVDPSDPTLAFLDKAHAELGPRSVIYIAFGTMFFPLPQSIGHLEIIIEEILAAGFRLVFALSSEAARMTGPGKDLRERLEKEGSAIFPEWASQLKLLEHPATHYFMSHGGWNSVTEAVVRNVPLIFWPCAGDQPTNAMQIATQLNCGFELLQIRTGTARNTAYPNKPITGSDDDVREEIKGLLEMSKGERGRQQRLNVKALGKTMRESLAKGGSGDRALGELGKVLGL